MAAWNKVYLPTKAIYYEKDKSDKAFVEVMSGDFKGFIFELPKKLVRNSRKDTVKVFSYTDQFRFKGIDPNGNVAWYSVDDFNHAFAKIHQECHYKIYGRR